MLRELAIKNFAIIEDLAVSFSQGLTVLSGETGAGKSVIVQAVNTLLGSRADAGQIRSGAETAELAALFEIDPDGPLGKKLIETGYAEGSELLIRRILSTHKTHRIYINGRMATLAALLSITEGMASISGQHEHQRLLRESEHLFILDRFAGLSGIVEQVRKTHAEILPRIRRTAEIGKQRQQQANRLELIAFEQREIKDAGITPEEEEELNCERIKRRHTL
ncbi:MAG: AAA family ATPase [Deltaproteobacteria bacterium]|nr:AAA family ATPase [Deltaproteobacteria bacterium]